jgi:hypothetical protein
MLKGDENKNNSLFYSIYAKWLSTYMILAFAIYFIIPIPLLLLISLGLTLMMNAILKIDKIKIILNLFKIDKITSFNNEIKIFYLKLIIN